MIALNLEGKTAIVTGAGNGLGKAIALRMAEAGANTIVSDIKPDDAKQVAEEIKKMGGSAIAVKTDVSKEQEVNDMVAAAVAEYGTVNIIVNNAGLGIATPFLETTNDQYNTIFDINVRGTYFACKAVMPHMIKAGGGNIINMSSQAAKKASSMNSLYSAAKMAVIGMTNSIALDYGPQNIKANCICPGIIRTDLWNRSLDRVNELTGADREAYWQKFVDTVPLKRAQTVDDIAYMAVYLASPLAENITAQAINVNGGHLGN